ncbi:centrosome-associated protein CEP250-like isoform X1 [Elysia marginata]|uniref:Centrosome-associated protein CEP250-like isoform X1 n=1 Tax=Elysia marginata TaxID=1093978 RepID=A0AAV4F6H7_9GAST|nr:centrosome-associated protein CEP250-like isoform X1 [Elysia marginata]
MFLYKFNFYLLSPSSSPPKLPHSSSPKLPLSSSSPKLPQSLQLLLQLQDFVNSNQSSKKAAHPPKTHGHPPPARQGAGPRTSQEVVLPPGARMGNLPANPAGVEQASVPKDEVSGRFAQFRRLSTNKLQELEDQLNLVTAKTRRKVATLKAQFQEHKGKWEAERKVLIEQVDQSIKLQGDAEKEADAAMTQLEDFITEQERLEQEEEQQRSEVLQASASLTPHSNVAMTPAQGRSVDHTPTAGTPLPHHAGASMSPDPEGELQRLMQQTDDAKSARQGESGPASAVTRSSSSGSVLVGRGLLDITKPFKEPSPTPEKLSGENTAVPSPTNAEKSKKASPIDREGAQLQQAEVTIVPAPMEVSEEMLNEVGLRITPENGHVAPLLVGTPREDKAAESVVAGPSGQPMPPSQSSKSDDQRPAPVVLLMMPEKEQQQQQEDQQQQPQQQLSSEVQADGSVHVQALIPQGLASVSSGELDPSAILEVKVIPQREAETLEDSQKDREPTSSSFVSRGESSFVVEGAPGEDKKPAPPIVQFQPVSPRGETFSSPRVTREALAAPRRSVSELAGPVFARLDLLALMKGRAKSAMVSKFAGKPTPSSTTTATRQQVPQPQDLQREGTGISSHAPEVVAPLSGRTPVALDGIDIDVTTPRNAQQVGWI